MAHPSTASQAKAAIGVLPSSSFKASLKAARLARLRPHRGAALLVAMVVLSLIATMAGGMVWQHSRAIQVEGAERARLQSTWVLNGALDWARLILREDMRGSGANTDHLGEPWAVPLAESRLSTFLAADRSGTTTGEDDGPDAFLSGAMVDAQARWNLTNLLKRDDKGKLIINPDQLRVLESICNAASAPSDTAAKLSTQWLKASLGEADAPLMPKALKELQWLGLHAAVIELLEPFIVLLPVPTPLNINTASAEVLAAVVPTTSAGWAQGIVERRQGKAFQDVGALALSSAQTDALQRMGAQAGLSVKTDYFIVRGRLRLDDRALEETSIVRRDLTTRQVVVVSRERVNLLESARALSTPALQR